MSKSSARIEILYVAVILLVCFILYFPALGKMSLWDTDEALYAQIAREMSRSGDYLTTQWNGQPWYCHPPLYFWMTAATARILGWNALAARLPSAVFGILTVVLVFFLGRLLFGSRAGFWAAMVASTTLQVWLQSRMAILDMPFLFFITLSVLFFYMGFVSPRPSWHYLGFWVSAGLAVLAKGPVGLILPLFYVLLIAAHSRRWDSLRRLIINPGIIIFVMIGVPWYAGMYSIYGRPFMEWAIDYFFLARIFRPVMNQGGPWYYYLPYFLAGFLPWTAFLPLVFYGFFKNLSDERARFLLRWIVGTLLIFTIAGTKRPNYILFVYPALSVALGWVIDRILSEGRNGRAFRLTVTAFSLSTIFVITAAGIAAGKFYPQYWAQYGRNLLPMGIVLLVGGVLTLVLAFRSKTAAMASILLMTVMSYLMLTSYIPLVESLRPEAHISSRVNGAMPPGGRLAMRGNFGRQFSILFYVDRPVEFYHSDEDLVKVINRGESLFVIEHGANYQRIRPGIRVPVQVVDERGGLVLLKTGFSRDD